MKPKFLSCFLLVCLLALSFNIQGQDKRLPKFSNPDLNPNLISGVPLTGGSESDAITAGWTTLAASPKAQSRTFCVYIQNGGVEYIYQFGGGSGTQLKSISRLNIGTNTWTLLGSVLNLDVSSGAAVADGDSVIYIFGGNSGTATLGSTQKFNVNTGITTTMAVMPNLITDAAVVKYRDTLVYLIGGGSGLFGTGYVNNVNLYNMRTNSYTAATAYPIAAGMMGFGIYGDTIICAGGWDGTTGTPNAYKGVINGANPTNITWTAIPNYPGGGVTRMASYYARKGSGNVIVFTGGAILGATLTNKTYVWNFCANNWDSTVANSQARSNFKAAGRGDSVVWVVAGFTTVGVGTTERLNFSQIDCAGPIANDVATTSINAPGNVTLPTSTIAPKATFQNVGANLQTNIPVTFKITGPVNYTSNKVIASLGTGASATVTFDSTFLPTVGSYNITVYCAMAVDNNRNNDTLKTTITVSDPNYGTQNGISFANSIPTNAPSNPAFCWKDTSGSTSLVVNRVNVSTAPFTGTLDDGYWRVGNALNGKKIRMGGVAYDSFFVSTNGIIGFANNSGLTSFSPSVASTVRPAIYPLWQDMDFRPPTTGGLGSCRISYKVISDFQLLVTYDRAQEYNNGIADTNDHVSYQVVIELLQSTSTDNSRMLVQIADGTNGNTGAKYLQYYNTNLLNTHVMGMQTAAGTSAYYRFAYPVSTYPGPLFGPGNTNLALEYGTNANILNHACGVLNLTLTASIEAMTPSSVGDTIVVLLRSTSSPYEIKDGAKAYLNGSGIANLTFQKSPPGSYFIAVYHRNALETWSAAGVNTSSYDFTTGVGQAYGSNMVVVSGEASFYSGDVNQDGVIDLTDGSDVDNDAFNFVAGYVRTDVNGDNVVDLTDAAFVDNNAFNFVGVAKP